MAGERNGTKCLLFRVDGGNNPLIVGQMELTNTFNGTPIDISTKSGSDWVSLMAGDLSTKGRTITATCTFSSDAEHTRMCQKAESGEIEAYVIDYTTIEADEVQFNGIPTALSHNLAMGDRVTTSISILSVGADL